MKTPHFWYVIWMTLAAFAFPTKVAAQGTITFDRPAITNGIAGLSLAQFDAMSFGMGFRNPPYDIMTHVGVGLGGYPYNGTPYAAFVDILGAPQFVMFALTDAASFGQLFTNGAPFGLVSVDLADPAAPSLTPIDITFNGFKADGSMVSQTFTAGGGGSTAFQTFNFGPDFAHGLLRVEIPSPAWAMDNLVWIPEPSSAALLLLGLLAVVFRKTAALRR